MGNWLIKEATWLRHDREQEILYLAPKPMFFPPSLSEVRRWVGQVLHYVLALRNTFKDPQRARGAGDDF